MSLFWVEKTLFWPVCLEVLPKITYIIKRSLLSTSCLVCFMLVLMMISCPAVQFFRRSLEETRWITIYIHDIIKKVGTPSCGSTGLFYFSDCDEMNCVKKLMRFIWPFPAENFKKLTKMKGQISATYWILISRITK